jgi:hypothetical protein
MGFWTPWNPTGEEVNWNQVGLEASKVVNNVEQAVAPIVQQVQTQAQQVINQASQLANQAVQQAQPIINQGQSQVQQIQQQVQMQANQSAQAVTNTWNQMQNQVQQSIKQVDQHIQNNASLPVSNDADKQLKQVANDALASVKNNIGEVVKNTESGLHNLITQADIGVKNVMNNPDVKKTNQVVDTAIKSIKETTGNTIDSIQTNTPIIAENYLTSLKQKYTEIPKEKSQEELKAIYDYEAKQPLWYQLLFGQSVIKDLDGKYERLEQMEMPFAPVPATRVIGAAELGMSDSQYLRFLNARVSNPELSPEQYKAVGDVINRANLSKVFSDLEDSRQFYNQIGNQASKTTARAYAARQQISGVYRPDYTWESTPSFLRPVQETEEIPNIINSIDEAIDIVQPQLRPIITLLDSGASFIDTLNKLIEQNAVSAALYANPEKTMTVIANSTPDLQTIVFNSISPDVTNAIKTGSIPEIKSAAKTELANQVIAANEIKALNEIAAQDLPANEIKTQIDARINSIPNTVIKNQVQAIVQPKTETNTNTQVQPKIETKTQTETNTNTQTNTGTKPQTKTQTKTETNTKPTTETKPQISSGYNPPRPNSDINRPPNGKFKVPDIVIPKVNNPEYQYSQLTTEQKNSKLAYKQGFIYIVRYSPYRDKIDVIYSRKPISGITYSKGIGSAQKSIVLNGSLPNDITFDQGAIDLTIKKTNEGNRPKMIYMKDLSFSNSNKMNRNSRVGNKHTKISHRKSTSATLGRIR